MKRALVFILLAGAAGGFGFYIASAGPPCTPPNCGGAISTDSANRVAIGTSTPTSSAQLLIVGSSTAQGYHALRVVDAGNAPLLLVRNDGTLSIATSSFSTTSTVWLGGPLRFQDGTVQSTAAGSATVQAQNVSNVGSFGQNTGGGNYSFPADLSIGTTTTGLAMVYIVRDVGVPFPGIRLRRGSGSVFDIYANDTTNVVMGASTGIPLIFGVEGLERFRLASGTGNIGIGYTNPTSTLVASGTIHIIGSGNGLRFPDGTLQTTAGGGSGTGWSRTGTTVHLTTSTDNVGIGTTSSDYTLELSGATAPKIALSDTGLAHGITSFAQTDTFFQVEQLTNDDGGARVWGFSDGVSQDPLRIVGAFGNVDPTDSIPGVWFLTGKRSGTSIVNLGSTETAFRFSNGDGATHFMTILGSGNIGIATTSPAVKLEVVESASSTAAIQASGNARRVQLIPNLGSGGWTGISQAGDSGIIFDAGSTGTGNLVIAPWNSGNGGIRIDSGGNVAIGTASPNIQGFGNTSGLLTIQNPSLTTLHGVLELANRTDADEQPIGELAFSASSQTGAVNLRSALIRGLLSGATANNRGSALTFYTRANGGTNDVAERVRIDASGNVGIGTTTPATKLHISGGDIRLSRSLGGTGTFGVIEAYNLGGGGEAASINLIRDAMTDWDYGGITFETRNAERMRITSGGLVGIGTASPSSTLHVAQTSSSTVKIGGATGCLILADSDGSGVTYVTAANGVLSATTTKPAACRE